MNLLPLYMFDMNDNVCDQINEWSKVQFTAARNNVFKEIPNNLNINVT